MLVSSAALMKAKTYLNHYRLCVDRVGIPVVIHRTPDETTLKAEEIESGAIVAVQLQPGDGIGLPEREQLEAEARAARQIDHINIPRLRDFGFDGKQLVYVTEHFEGITAEEWIKAHGPLSCGEVLRVAAQVVSALVAASLHGIMHYAVVPGNIMLAPRASADGEWPRIKVLNFFGRWSSLSSSNSPEFGPLNPARFISPEQLAHEPINFRSEIYSLGCTLWFLLKGQPLTGGAATVREASDLPAPVQQLLAAMVAKIPAARPADPLALHEQIQDCLAQLARPDDVAAGQPDSPTAPAAVPVDVIEPQPSAQERSAWKPVALAALLLALALLGAVIIAQRVQQTASIEAIAPAPASAAPVLPSPAPVSAVDQKIASQTQLFTPAPDPVAATDVVEKSSEDDAELSATESPVQVASEGDPLARAEGQEAALQEQDIMPLAPPVIASTSSARDADMASEATREPVPDVPETPPPAEGPGETLPPSAPPGAEPVAQENSALLPVPARPDKPAARKRKRTRKLQVKKALPAETAPLVPRGLARHKPGPIQVGSHPFLRPPERRNESALEPARRKTRRDSPR